VADLVTLARDIATQHGLDPALVCGMVLVESDWKPWASRYESAFFARYLDNSRVHLEVREFLRNAPFHATFETELRERAFSRGLLQIMGQVARERGFKGLLPRLHDPEVGLEYGCRHLKWMLGRAEGITRIALLKYNGGGDPSYPNKVLLASEKYA